ncbi:1270_t:CDS:10 [Paraglomus brasilianum]|uniref:Prolyl endopeptidase n=1 Tax=Paraglomus brasilianum TaxID=144538 RepID=A0A9N9GN48_9GLOM|nr:1270_t:CDS:10 [Paraglomus brasilianum]
MYRRTRLHPLFVVEKINSLLSSLRPPVAKRIPFEESYFGIKRVDEYRWLEDSKDPDVNAYIEAENSYAKQMMKPTKTLQRRLITEMRQKLITTRLMPPLKTVVNGYEFYSRNSKRGLVYYRRKREPGATETVLFDSRYIANTGKRVRSILLSPDTNMLSYLLEEDGTEIGSLYFKDLTTNKILQTDELQGVFNFVWSANNKYVYYTMTDEQLRPCRVYVHRIGSGQSDDVLIYNEKKESAFVDITLTKDKKLITIHSSTLSSSEVHIFDAYHSMSDGPPALQLIEPRKSDLEYYVDHHDDCLYILTNANGAKNFKLTRARQPHTSERFWEDLIVMNKNERIQDIDIFRKFITIYAKRDGLPVIQCYDFRTSEIHEVKLPMRYCTISPGNNLDHNTDIVQFHCTSPLTLQSTLEYNMETRVLNIIRSHPIHRFNPTWYDCYRVYAKGSDGTEIPITLIHKKGLKLDGRNPLLLRTYGAYGSPTEPDFQIEHLPLVERDWIIALAHVRGGGELGHVWYENGRAMKKKNTFIDIITVAEYLIRSGYSSKSRMTAIGASAGGLALGSVLNARPDLFRAVILRVPFLDPLSSMLNPSIPLTRLEYDEWGNPKESEAAYRYIESYAPYDNIPYHLTTPNNVTTTGNAQKTTYPAPSILVTAGMRDQRVAYWQPLKWVARVTLVLVMANWVKSKS